MIRARARRLAGALLLAALLLTVGPAPARADSKWTAWPKKSAPAKTSGKTAAPPSTKASTKAAAKAPAKASAKAPPAAKGAAKTRAAAAARMPPKTKADAKVKEPPPPRGKLAVFAFGGESTSAFRNQVVRVLRGNGFKVVTSLRPVDSAEQYREMAATLGLAAYVGGDIEDDGSGCSATITVRSGTTGQRVASATFSGERHKLPDDIGKTLWTRVGPTLQRARADAAKPRKLDHAPMRIDAGTPL